MSVGNCTQPGKCPQAIRAIYNPQTGTYLVDPETKPVVYPQTQNPPEKPWDWGAIAKNTIMWTVGIGTAALLGIRTFGAIKNHEAGKQYFEKDKTNFVSLPGKKLDELPSNLVSTLRIGDLFPNSKTNNKLDQRTCIGANKSALLKHWCNDDSEMKSLFQSYPLLKLVKGNEHYEYEGLEVPAFYHLKAGFRYLSNFFSGTKRSEVDVFTDHASS
jgi:hypothetical protein